MDGKLHLPFIIELETEALNKHNNLRTWLILGRGKLPMVDDIAAEDLLGQKLDVDVSTTWS